MGPEDSDVHISYSGVSQNYGYLFGESLGVYIGVPVFRGTTIWVRGLRSGVSGAWDVGVRAQMGNDASHGQLAIDLAGDRHPEEI